MKSHSEVPTCDDEWPSQVGILEFQTKVRKRLLSLYDDIKVGKVTVTRKLARVLFMTLEHEAMHAETLLYMLLQRAGSGTIPPPGFAPPAWESLAAGWNAAPKPADPTVILGPASVALGHDDDESCDQSVIDNVRDHEFGWDNENPKRQVEVGQFRIEWRPVTNREFYEYYLGPGKGKVALPTSWVEDGAGIRVDIMFSLNTARKILTNAK